MATPIFAQPTGQSLIQDFYSMHLEDRFVMPEIVNLRPQFTSMNYLINKLNASPIMSNKMIAEQPYWDVATITAQCVSTTLSQGNSIATVTITGNGSRDLFGNGYMVRDNVTQTEARVIAHTASTLTLQFASSATAGVTAFTSSDFAATNPITETGVGLLSNYNDPRTIQGLKKAPALRKIPLSTITNSVTLTKAEMIEKNRIIKAVQNGVQFMAWTQVENMISNFITGVEERMFYSNQTIPDQLGNGSNAGSLLWQIKNEDGIYIPMTTAPDDTYLRKAIEAIRDKKGKGGKIGLFGGTLFNGSLQQAISNKWLQYTGSDNTFGGKTVDGINVKHYTYLDIDLEFYTDFNNFNHPYWNQTISSITGTPYSQNSALILDTDPVENSLGAPLPFASQICYGLDSDQQIGAKGGTYQIVRNGNIDEYGNNLREATGDSPTVTFTMSGNMATILNRPQNSCLLEMAS